jgi:FAD binding domain-containing protein
MISSVTSEDQVVAAGHSVNVAGPALGVLLHRDGHEVTVVERARSLRENGHAVDFRGVAFEVLEEMGILERVCAHATGIAARPAGRGRQPHGRAAGWPRPSQGSWKCQSGSWPASCTHTHRTRCATSSTTRSTTSSRMRMVSGSAWSAASRTRSTWRSAPTASARRDDGRRPPVRNASPTRSSRCRDPGRYYVVMAHGEHGGAVAHHQPLPLPGLAVASPPAALLAVTCGPSHPPR